METSAVQAIINQPPVAVDDSVVINEDTSIAIPVLANDSDPDPDAVLSIVDEFIDGSLGFAIPNEDGTLTYIPFQNANGTDSITYTIEDGNGGSDTATVTIEILPMNDPPQSNVFASSILPENGITTTLSIFAFDPDGDPLTYSIDGQVMAAGVKVELASGAIITGNNKSNYTYDTNGAFEFLSEGEQLRDTVSVSVSDGNGGVLNRNIGPSIFGLNDEPEAVDDTAATDEDTAFTIQNVLANDRDIDRSDVLTVAGFDTTGTLGQVTDNGDGTFGYDPAGAFEALNDGDTATDSFTYTIDDGHGGTDTAAVTITIDGIDDCILGTDGSDLLKGTGEADCIDGGGGNDLLFGKAGDDQLSGGAGKDALFGNGGGDMLDGGDGKDAVVGGGGDDWLFDDDDDNDIYTGNSGADIFAFANTEDQTDAILDFRFGGGKDSIAAASDDGTLLFGRHGRALEQVGDGDQVDVRFGAYRLQSGEHQVEILITQRGTLDFAQVASFDEVSTADGTDIFIVA